MEQQSWNYASELADKILQGHQAGKSEITKLISQPLDEVVRAAFLIKENRGNQVSNFCTIINAKSGRCAEDCKYCAQSGYYQTGIKEYPLLSKEEVTEAAKSNEALGVDYFSIVTSGRKLNEAEFNDILDMVDEINKKTKLKVCVSSGLLSKEQFVKLKEAGLSNYHHNVQTSENYFNEIITTHSFTDKLQTIKDAFEAGLDVCAGGIIGMGESFYDRIDMAYSLKEVGVTNIPINILVPIPGTPLENAPPIVADDVIRTIAIFRFIHPKANLIYGAGRNSMTDREEEGYLAGITSVITGDCLTTTGSSVARDKQLIKTSF